MHTRGRTSLTTGKGFSPPVHLNFRVFVQGALAASVQIRSQVSGLCAFGINQFSFNGWLRIRPFAASTSPNNATSGAGHYLKCYSGSTLLQKAISHPRACTGRVPVFAYLSFSYTTRHTVPLPSSVTNNAPSCATVTPTGRPQTFLLSTTKPVRKSSYCPVGTPSFSSTRMTL